MEKSKRILFKLLFPHIVVVIVLVPLAGAVLIYALAVPGANLVVAYASYALSAYALAVLCARIPAIVRGLKALKTENRYVSAYLSDVHLRMKISLYSSVSMNTLYGLMQLISGFYFHSVWFYALAGYYGLLALMRYFLLKERVQKKRKSTLFMEYLHYRFCGVLLLLMNVALAVIVFYIVWQNRGFAYHYIQTIAMAVYTFTSLTLAIINVVKYRRYASPVMSAAKDISLVSALVSMLSLETAMLTAFGEANTPQFRQIMTALTGAAVCVAVLAIAVYMIVHSTKKINKIKKERKFDERSL